MALQRRVVCAANVCKDIPGLMICGPRHWDPVMRTMARTVGLEVYGPLARDDIFNLEWDQGFIDQWGVWMDRVEAMQVAKAADQVLYYIGYESEQLYSEHLY